MLNLYQVFFMKKMSEEQKKNRLLLHYLDYTNKTNKNGKFELPIVKCNTDILPDYIALFSQQRDYHHTPKTAVAYFQFDNLFNGQHGLYNAIYYNNRKDLRLFKKRFKGIRFAIAPDCSECGDIDLLENLHRLRQSRVMSLWLTIEMGICVIPLITFPNLEFLPLILNGLKECNVVAFSTKGYITNSKEKEILREAIKRTVDTLHLKSIVVYDVCKTDEKAITLFDYARQKGILIVIPDNILKNRNKLGKDKFKRGQHAK